MLDAVTTRSYGRDSLFATRVWYRVAVNGVDTPAKIPYPLCRIGEVFPCLRCDARITSPPNTEQMVW